MTQDYAERERPARLESEPAASEPCLRAAPVTHQEFCAGFDRCFGRVYAYVSRRVNDRKTCERIVSGVLTESVDLLVDRADEGRELSRLKASSDRLIELEAASSASTGRSCLASASASFADGAAGLRVVGDLTVKAP